MNFNTFVNSGEVIPSFRERKQILYRDPAWQPHTTLVLDSSQRSSGGISNPTWTLPQYIRGCYALSLKSWEIPVSWPNVTSAITLAVTYGANTGGYPTSITIPIGRYNYNNEIGIVTYTTANAAPSTSYTDDLMYVILRLFAGALTSISINASTGVWTWNWNSAQTSVTSTSASVTSFFNISNQASGNTYTWVSSGPVDLTGPKVITLCCGDIARNAYSTAVVNAPCYLCSLPVQAANYGDLISWNPQFEKIVYFADSGKVITALNFMVMDPRTATMISLSADWAIELKIYIDALN